MLTEPTVVLAVMSVLGHCLAIFWPRKPIKGPVDENGFPILWCNNDEKQENIARVWRIVAEQPADPLQEETAHRRSA